MKAPLLRLTSLATFFWLLLPFTPAFAGVATNSDVTALDRILASVQPGQKLVTVGDMRIPAANLTAWRNQLAGTPSPQSAFDGLAPKWTGGNVYYTFSSNTNDGTAVATNQQRAFLDAAGEWATFANVHFIARTSQSNYVTVQVLNGSEGGQADVGMVGGQQFLSVGPNSWNRGTLCHELGHTLGLVHEHQRSDRNSYVTILSNNVNGDIGNFVLLGNSQNQGAYDFLSIMHYARNYLSFSTNLDTIEPLPAYTNFINLMGVTGPIVLSLGDRTGMAAVYGTVATNSPVVTNTLDSGLGSLRAALYYAYDHPSTHVTFNIPTNDPGYQNGVFTIRPSDQLPWLVNSTFLDASSQPTNSTSNANGPLVQLDGSLTPALSPTANGLRFAGTNSTASGFVINGFASSGVLFNGSNTVFNTLMGCYISTDPTGTFSVSNVLPSVTISGRAAINVVGGTNAAARNLLSGSGNQGLVIMDPGTTNNIVIGNWIGLNGTGTGGLSNRYAGIEIYNGAAGNFIGDFLGGNGNVISGNGYQGILISDAGTSINFIMGNYIGLNPTGTAAIPNGEAGIEISGTASGNLIGGNGSGNIISGNTNQGVKISGVGTIGNNLQGNLIGLNAAGTAAVPNGWAGVEIDFGATENFIGGSTPGSGNVISGNGIQGIALRDPGTALNLIFGNYIGLNQAGTAAIGNSASGIESFLSAGPNYIGASGGGRNYICGNTNNGILLDSSSPSYVIQGNSIGVCPFNTPVPNQFSGIEIFGGSTRTLIGGTNAGEANLIANNLNYGIVLYDSTTLSNTVRGNSIYSNSFDGFDVFSGANGSPTPPTMTSATVGTNTIIKGNVTSTNANTFAVDLYANPPAASPVEAQQYLGSKSVIATKAGIFAFTFTTGGIVPIGWKITATATDSSGNTSGLSTSIATVTGTDSVGDGIPDAWRALYFGGSGTTTNSTNCATCDPDHDGLNNRQEFFAGTNPTNSGSALRAGTLTQNGFNVDLSFSSLSGVVYRVDYKDDLAATNWTLLSDQILGTGSVLQLPSVSYITQPQRFFRVEVLP